MFKQLLKYSKHNGGFLQALRLNNQNKNYFCQKNSQQNDFMIKKVLMPLVFAKSYQIQRIFIKEGETPYDGQVLLEIRKKGFFSNHDQIVDYHFYWESFEDDGGNMQDVVITKINIQEKQSYKFYNFDHTAFEIKVKNTPYIVDGYLQHQISIFQGLKIILFFTILSVPAVIYGYNLRNSKFIQEEEDYDEEE